MNTEQTSRRNRLRRGIIGVTASLGLAAGTVIAVGTTPAAADYTLCAKYDSVAVRTQPDGTARDNLAKGHAFVVQQGGSGDNYVYGYKRSNDVHGYVKRSSLEGC